MLKTWNICIREAVAKQEVIAVFSPFPVKKAISDIAAINTASIVIDITDFKSNILPAMPIGRWVITELSAFSKLSDIAGAESVSRLSQSS